MFFKVGRTDGLPSPYTQVFARTDQILVQVICDDQANDSVAIILRDWETGKQEILTASGWYINDFVNVVYVALQGLSDGVYSLIIADEEHTKDYESQPFRVTSDPAVLDNTTLIQYSMRDNRQRTDAMFLIDNMRYFFDFRVPGGIRDNGYSFGVTNEQFTTDNSDIIELYARESTQCKLTVGTSEGCPIWFGDLLNRLLCCHYVYVDGVRYARKDAAVPEVSQPLEGVNSFVLTQSLQKVVNLDPAIEGHNQAILRRVINDWRITNDTTNRLIK